MTHNDFAEVAAIIKKAGEDREMGATILMLTKSYTK
jgi:hypothetical protein